MRLVIVPGPVDKVHLPTCGHTRRSMENGNATRIQGPRAERMLNLLRTDPGQMVPSDGQGGTLPKGYFQPCKVCRPLSATNGA